VEGMKVEPRLAKLIESPRSVQGVQARHQKSVTLPLNCQSP
jgi:hypothetical protein